MIAVLFSVAMSAQEFDFSCSTLPFEAEVHESWEFVGNNDLHIYYRADEMACEPVLVGAFESKGEVLYSASTAGANAKPLVTKPVTYEEIVAAIEAHECDD